MEKRTQRFDSIVPFLASKRLAITLFLLCCAVLVPLSVAEKKGAALAWPHRILFGCLALNLVACTLHRARTLPRPVLIIHAGVIVIIAGAVIGSFGYVATVNVYGGGTVSTAYRWDLEHDAPLGFDLAVRSINSEYYPSPVRVGVLQGDRKVGLFELKTGQAFAIGQYRVTIEAIVFPEENLELSVADGTGPIGTADTSGRRDLPSGFPYDFKLVAFKNPVLKRISVDLELSRDGAVFAKGSSEVNSPFIWQGLAFYHTKAEQDQYGAPYAGIQIVRDPGAPVVFAGFLLLIGGTLFWVYDKQVRRRRGQRAI